MIGANFGSILLLLLLTIVIKSSLAYLPSCRQLLNYEPCCGKFACSTSGQPCCANWNWQPECDSFKTACKGACWENGRTTYNNNRIRCECVSHDADGRHINTICQSRNDDYNHRVWPKCKDLLKGYMDSFMDSSNCCGFDEEACNNKCNNDCQQQPGNPYTFGVSGNNGYCFCGDEYHAQATFYLYKEPICDRNKPCDDYCNTNYNNNLKYTGSEYSDQVGCICQFSDETRDTLVVCKDDSYGGLRPPPIPNTDPKITGFSLIDIQADQKRPVEPDDSFVVREGTELTVVVETDDTEKRIKYVTIQNEPGESRIEKFVPYSACADFKQEYTACEYECNKEWKVTAALHGESDLLLDSAHVTFTINCYP